ncbi:MaoC family dehydratase [Rhodococcus sp. NPDC127528]|uniref:MaoC family dehydratase n=1 Tax=unclassified Rhodococcus (in: high G+C Gram-positive bacteria) TaxID=192944 RepID=UPI0036406C39
MTAALWLDDIEVGSTYRTGSYEMTRDDIVAFARQYDPQPFHLGDDTAADTFFEGLAASGWHTAAVTMRLLVTSGLPIAHGIIGAGVDLKWPTPTRPGDILHVELTVTGVKVSRSNPTRGIVTTEHNTINQHGEIRQRTTARLLVFTQPDGHTG